jgi:RNA polymerase sigma-70 factor (ECF subfamily)
MSSLSDKIIQGDQEAILLFYNQYSGKIKKYLQTKLPACEDVEEVLNDVFFSALDNLPLFRRDSSIKTWLYSIAHHKVVDFYRKRKIKSVLLSQVPYLEIVDKEVHQPEFLFEKEKVRDNIEAALQKISDLYRFVLTLRYEEKRSVKEMALVLDLSFKATESLLFRARKSFQQAYARE